MDEVNRYRTQVPFYEGIKTPLFWIIRKQLLLSRFRTGLTIMALAATSANFTLLYTLATVSGEGLTVIPAAVITFIALAAILLYPAFHSDHDIGALKALGADRLTVTTLYFVELLVTGLVGVLIGVLAGGGSIFIASLLNPYGFTMISSVTGYWLVVLLCFLGVAAGSLVGVYHTWKKTGKTTAEILAHAK